MILQNKKNNVIRLVFIAMVFLGLFSLTFAQSSATIPLSSSLVTTGQLTVGKVAPGENLPLQVQLINFGTPEERVDVTLLYSIKNSLGKVILDNTETVAVQTTASFVKNVYIPTDFKTGTYTIDLLMAYRDQKYPAISRAQFKVQKKYLGFFISDWFRAFPVMLIPLLLVFLWNRGRKKQQVVLRPNYAHIPEEERTYYEIVHDIIVSIHHHVGDKEMKNIITRIPGLTLDISNLYIEELEGSIEVIVARLINEYEKIIGKKANIITKSHYQKNRIQTQ